MLDGLDLVPWEKLTHAYGNATDVPTILRGLAEGDAEALDALFGNIWHQGTVYPATSHAVPFLIELLEGSKADVAGVLALLSSIARGSSYLAAHQSLRAPSERATEAQIETELVWVRAAREAVGGGAPTFLRLLAHRSEEVRAAAASVLASCGRAHAEALLEIGRREESATVRSSIVFALGAPVADFWFSDAAPAVRVSAAFFRPSDPRSREILLKDAPLALNTLETVPFFAESGDVITGLLTALGDRWEFAEELLEVWLQDEHREVRRAAVLAAEVPMLRSRASASRLCPALTARLADEDQRVGEWAARLLGQGGSATRGAADALWWALQRGDPAPATIPGYALRALLNWHDPRSAGWMERKFRHALAEGGPLGFAGQQAELLGPWAPQCLEPLIRLIPRAERGNECIAVIKAVGSYGVAASSAVAAIHARLTEHPHIATRVLGDLGLVAAPALSSLRNMVDHENDHVASNAARAVFRIAGDAGPALRRLERAFATNSVTTPMLGMLAELGPLGLPVAANLPPLFEAENEWVSVEAAAAWYAVTGKAAPVLPTLLRRLAPRLSGFVAVECVAAIGVEARAAAPALRSFLDNPLRQLRAGIVNSAIAEDERWMAACARALSKVEPS